MLCSAKRTISGVRRGQVSRCRPADVMPGEQVLDHVGDGQSGNRRCGVEQSVIGGTEDDEERDHGVEAAENPYPQVRSGDDEHERAPGSPADV
jgi:hypothetical protein